MSAFWLVSSTGDEIINSRSVTHIYEKNGKVYAGMQRGGQALDVELEVNELLDIRKLIESGSKVI